MWPAGTAWSPIRGCVGLEAGMSPGYQAGVLPVYAVGAAIAAYRAPTGGKRTKSGARRESGVVLQRPPTGAIPDAPGSYQFQDADGRVLYVGKAKSLRHRLPSYWQDPSALPARTAQMVSQAERVEWVVVQTEVEALMLEHSLIQRHQPRFNVRLKDDKSYPWLAVTVSDEWPRPAVVRGRKRRGVRYFGPYGHVRALRETLDLLLRSFPIRTCSEAKFRRHERLGRPCLLFDIERCSGPCVGAVDHEQYSVMVEDLMRFLEGETAPVIQRLETEMQEAADGLEYERAARLRDRLTAVRKAAERQQMVSERPENIDVIGVADDELEAAVQVFHVRRGRVVGNSGFIADKVEDLSRPQLIGRIVEELFSSGTEVPRRVLVPEEPDAPELLGSWLSTVRGGPVTLSVPLRGPKRALQEMVTRNAAESLARHRLRRASDHNSRSKALTELQAALELPQAPLRIECYDMSHLQGTDYVGSMVVFEDAIAKRSDYRHFRVRSVAGNDDYAAMEEVLTRRLTALEAERADPERLSASARGRRFAYAPQLLLLDGGKGQLGVGIRVLDELGLTDEIQVAALAKTFEEVFVPGRDEPIRLARGSEALYLLQRLRDEAHRFAITFHRQRRATRMTKSVLDDVPGLGQKRRSRLLREVGSIRALRQLSQEELASLPWLPEAVGRAVYEKLHGPGGITAERSRATPSATRVGTSGNGGAP